ncbi:MAG: DotU family type IV/VI secretion system protein [Leptospirillum sp.]|jgi:type VI secretion system protein ImpK
MMTTLSDCLIPVLAYTKDKLDRTLPEAEKLRQEIRARIDLARSCAKSAGIPETSFENALFPVVVWIDESLMCANWPGADEWSRNMLQKTFFRITNGGVEFYRRMPLEGGDPESREILSLYHMALQLGFRGQYALERTEHEVQKVRKHLQDLLGPDRSVFEQEKIFPEGYLVREDAKTTTKVASRKTLNTVFIWLVPSVMVLVLFLLYDRIIHSMTQNVLRHLH